MEGEGNREGGREKGGHNRTSSTGNHGFCLISVRWA
jgi:hypothetical protein